MSADYIVEGEALRFSSKFVEAGDGIVVQVSSWEFVDPDDGTPEEAMAIIQRDAPQIGRDARLRAWEDWGIKPKGEKSDGL